MTNSTARHNDTRRSAKPFCARSQGQAPLIIESRPGLLVPRKASDVAANGPSWATPPAGYKLVDSESHEITARDMVFVGGLRSYWMPARRAGEVGSLRRHSVVIGVASLAA